MLDTKGPRSARASSRRPTTAASLPAKGHRHIDAGTTDYDHKSDGTKLGCTYKKLPTSVKPGGQILVADGSLDKDTKDLVEFACPMGVDFVAVSFVQSARDAHGPQDLDGAGGTKIKIISKIENQEGLDNFASIVDETDSVMVGATSHGDPPSLRRQKSMIATCNGAGKPVIVATQMLESMVSNPRPTPRDAEGEFDFDAAYQKELATMRESGRTRVIQRRFNALIPGAYVLHVPDLVKYGYADDTGDDESKMVAEGTKFACSLGLVTSGDDFSARSTYRVNKQKNIAMRFFHASSVL
ncbi:pyruvate kinase [Aureococcus anophagefferens]|nr:pyruvate kinase [Aureococcus anophagefferens]